MARSDSAEPAEAAHDPVEDRGAASVAQMPDLYVDGEIASLRSRAHLYLGLGIPVHFRGRAGMGKTTLALRVAHELGRPVSVVTGDRGLSSADLVGREVGRVTERVHDRYVHRVARIKEEARALWADGVLTKAMIEGHTLVYDEFTRAPAETNNILLSVLEERVLHLTSPLRDARLVRAHPAFRAILTSNPDEYSGVQATPDALFDRMVSVDVSLCGPETEAGIVAFRTGVARKAASAIVRLLRAVRKAAPGANPPSIRTAIMIGKIIHSLEIPPNAGDERFVQVCLDVLEARCPGGDRAERARHLAALRDEILRTATDRSPSEEAAA
ncbi:MAG: gas vesicle protein GvpN [Pikeienuella sp.]